MFVGWCKATSLSLNGEQQLLGDNAKDIFLEVQLYWGVKSFNFTLCSDWVRVFSHIAGQAQGKATSVCQLVCLSVAPPLRSCDYSNGTLMRISGEMPQQLSEMWLRYSCLPQDPFTFCAMMWYEIWACIFLIIENTLILILSHCAFQKGSCTKVNNPHWEYYDQNQLPPPLHATVRHPPDCTLRRTLRFGSDSRWMQRSITSLVMLRWEGSSAFTSGPSRSSTSSHSAGGGTSGDSDGEIDDIWLTDLANVYPYWQV